MLPGDVVLLPSGAVAEVTGRDGEFFEVVYIARGTGKMMIHRKYLELITDGITKEKASSHERCRKAVR